MSREEAETIRSLVEESKRMRELTKTFYDKVAAEKASEKPISVAPEVKAARQDEPELDWSLGANDALLTPA